jgi:hypothetical protein
MGTQDSWRGGVGPVAATKLDFVRIFSVAALLFAILFVLFFLATILSGCGGSDCGTRPDGGAAECGRGKAGQGHDPTDFLNPDGMGQQDEVSMPGRKQN